LQAAEEAGVVNKDAHRMWAVALPRELAREVALLMRGARLYRDRVHADEVEVVISRPAAPSRLVAELERTIEGLWGLEETAVMLGEMAAIAKRRFSVMTPFVDEDGAERIVSLFRATRPGVERELVVRNGLRDALAGKAGELKALGVGVYDFRIPRPDRPENETFHAKVVRVDDSECYAGSSNMTKWSFEYSLELGFHVRGAAAAKVSRLLDAVVAVSAPVSL
jgi:phosphatidylserine/phosphatidylglycerophosphate/cardiolipin synthase-like enzyme